MSMRQLLPGFVLLVACAFPGASPASAMTPTPTPTVTPTPMPPLADIVIPANAATASTDDGNVPANTLDHDLRTRWAGYGEGAWIRYDLGTPRTIAQVRIGVYRGNERRNRFDLQVSADGSTWSPLLTNGLTSGTTTQEQLFDVADTSARFLRYVGHGSTAGLWNSVTEIRLITYTVQPSCTVSVSQAIVQIGDTVTVTARSNMGLNQFRIGVIDKSTGQLQDEMNPIFTPARPAPINTSGQSVWWTLTAVRKGTVEFRVDTNGELYDPACACTSFRNAFGTSVAVTVGFVFTPTPTPPACVTPTPPPTPAPINPAVVGGDRYAVLTWQSAYASTEAHKYEVARATSSSGPWTTLASVDLTGTRDGRYVDQAVVNGTRYFYAVRELWTWTYGTAPCPVQTLTLRSPDSAVVSTTPGITTGTEITPARGAVTASTSDGNVPGNTVDNNLATRWSGDGDGAVLTLDLGASRTVDYVKLAAHRGNERRNRLDLQLSNDGVTWTTAWHGETTGLTLSEEVFDVPDQLARYVRYVGHGSSAGSWNSVTEVSVFAP
jgi:hypothetical protein